MTTTTDDEQALTAEALSCLEGLLQAAELQADARLSSQDGEAGWLVVSGPDAGLLVGPHGQTLDALQYLLMLAINKGRDHRLRITVDADGYRARRSQTLIRFAHDLAAQVSESGQEAITDPLNAMERRIIHTALVDHTQVQTYSEGDDPDRYVVISPRTGAAPAADGETGP